MKRLLLLLFFIAVGSAQNCLSSADRLINKRCFTFVNQQLNYQDARDWCHFRNPVTFSYLATIPDTTTANFLASYARTIFNTNDGSFWIGLSRYNTSSRFQWDDGTPVSWTNFQVQNAQNYVAESITNAKFTTYPSENKYNFICSYDPNGSQTGRPSEGLDTTTVAWGTTAEPDGPTPTGPSCTTSTPRTFLLAYSTDLFYDQVQYLFENLKWYLSQKPLWNTYARVRMDMKNKEDIQYFKDTNAFNQSLYSNYPDPSLGNLDNTTGSDMFDMLKKFLKNTEYLCGSTVMIAAKRYPNEVEIEDLISELQKNHVFVYILSSDTPSGGSNPSAMVDVATRTNGYCAFSSDDYHLDEMYLDAEALAAHSPNQIVASKFAVSGKGRQSIPFKTLLNPEGYNNVRFEIVYQDHKVDGSLISMDYSITDGFGNKYSSYDNIYIGYTGFLGGFNFDSTAQYYLNIGYEYQEGRQEVMLVRMNSEFYIPDDWLPFNN